MLVMYLAWLVIKRIPTLRTEDVNAADSPLPSSSMSPRRGRWFDLVDTASVDLFRDEHKDDVTDLIEDQERDRRLNGRLRWFWRLYYTVA